MSSLYDELGGESTVNAAVDSLYRRILKDDRIRLFFEGVNMQRQIAKQKAFLTKIFAGPNRYTGADIRNGHAHLVAKGLNDSHFDAFIENLKATLQELEISPALIDRVGAYAETQRHDVLGR
jgi:hemoglobin